jgi:hypothetical protein
LKRISPHLVRAPQEPLNEAIRQFYGVFLSVIKKPLFRDGRWRLIECVPAWEWNGTWDSFLAFAWEGADAGRALVTVNYSPHDSQCFVRLPFTDLADKTIRFSDLMSPAVYDRDGNELISRGLFLNLPAWGYHVFEVESVKS